MHKKTALLTVAWDNTDTAFEIVKAYYKKICEYMQLILICKQHIDFFVRCLF